MSDTFKVIPVGEAIAAFDATPPSTLAKQTFTPWDWDGMSDRKWKDMVLTNGETITIKPEPTRAPKRPDELWWVEWMEGMPPEPACISFLGEEPHGILEIGSDYTQDLADRDVRLVARVPAFAPDQVVITREEFATMWDALRWRDREVPNFDWLDALKGRVDAQKVEEA